MNEFQNISEEKKEEIFDKCYSSLPPLYEKFKKVAEYWEYKPEEIILKNPSEATWEDFTYGLEEIKKLSKGIDKHLKDNPEKIRLIGNIRKYGIKTRNEYRVWFDLLEKMRLEVQKKDSTFKKDAYLPILASFITMYAKDHPDILKETDKSYKEAKTKDGDRFLSFMHNTLIAIYKPEEYEEMIGWCNRFSKVGKVFSEIYEVLKDKIVVTSRSYRYLSERMDRGVKVFKISKKEDSAKKDLEKINKTINSIKKRRKKTIPKEKTQADIIYKMHKATFSKIPKSISQEEKDLINMKFAKDIAKSVEELEQVGFESLQKLTGIDYQTLFHVINSERELTNSEKDAYYFITREEYV